MENLQFKTTEAAFEYAKKYFKKIKPSVGESYVGIIRIVDKSSDPVVYAIDIICSVRKFLTTGNSLTAITIGHPELQEELSKNDLVIFGLDSISQKSPTGLILYKLLPELDIKSGAFKKIEYKKKFKVFIYDNFQYMKEDERYFFAEYDNLDDATEACKRLVDRSIEDLMNDCSLFELLERYQNFGDDPFIDGGNFSAWDYAKNKIEILILQRKKEDHSYNIWKYQIDHTYGQLLRESEILEEPGLIYFSQTDRRRLCVSWNVDLQVWKVNINRNQLDGLSFSTVKRFEEIVFCEDDDLLNYKKKQYLVELLLNGVNIDETKSLNFFLDDGARIEFTLSSATWNEMLIGSHIEVKGGFCNYFESDDSENKVISFGLICDGWDLEIEYLLDDSEGIVKKNLQLKELGNYYS